VKKIYVLIAVALVGVALWFYWRHHDKKTDTQISSPVLAPSDQARINIDPKRGTITVVDRTGPVRRTYIGQRPVAVHIGPRGEVSVVNRKFGTEIQPFVGIGFGSDVRLRAALGLNLFYISRWDMGGGLLLSSDIHDTRIFAHVGYTAYSNIMVAVGVDNRKTVHCIASLKF
jgi:hypothetical protein